MVNIHLEICPFCRGLHWHTYQYLESKLVNISNVIVIDRKNHKAWGEELADLLVLTGNAMDTFFRNMYDCPNFKNDPNYLSIKKPKEKWDISDYRRVFEPYYELSKNVITAGYGLGDAQKIRPFSRFSERRPSWWSAYNKVKHEYYDHLPKANLRNVLNCLGGLLILNAIHLCSSRHLAKQGIIRSYLADYDSMLHPDYISERLLQSKIGATKHGTSICSFRTNVYRFIFRSDDTVKTDDPLLISLDK